MLNQSDLDQIKAIVSSEVEPLKKVVSGEIEPLKKDMRTIKKDITQIRKDVQTIISFFDRETLELRKRVDRIETHLGLGPLPS